MPTGSNFCQPQKKLKVWNPLKILSLQGLWGMGQNDVDILA